MDAYRIEVCSRIFFLQHHEEFYDITYLFSIIKKNILYFNGFLFTMSTLNLIDSPNILDFFLTHNIAYIYSVRPKSTF